MIFKRQFPALVSVEIWGHTRLLALQVQLAGLFVAFNSIEANAAWCISCMAFVHLCWLQCKSIHIMAAALPYAQPFHMETGRKSLFSALQHSPCKRGHCGPYVLTVKSHVNAAYSACGCQLSRNFHFQLHFIRFIMGSSSAFNIILGKCQLA